MFFHGLKDKVISPWHDIPLMSGDLYHFIVEIPKNTQAKMEVQTKEQGNPIAQDIKKGKLRDYHGPIYWNYGCIPQTWEDPTVEHAELKCKGDNDPLDVVRRARYVRYRVIFSVGGDWEIRVFMWKHHTHQDSRSACHDRRRRAGLEGDCHQ